MRVPPALAYPAAAGVVGDRGRRWLLRFGMAAFCLTALAPRGLAAQEVPHEPEERRLSQLAQTLADTVAAEVRRAETALLTAAGTLEPGRTGSLSVAAMDRLVRAAAASLGLPVTGLSAQLAPLVDSQLPAGTPLPASPAGALAAEALVTLRPVAGPLPSLSALALAVPLAREGARPLGVLVAQLPAERLSALMAAALVADGPAEDVSAAALVARNAEGSGSAIIAWVRPGPFPATLVLPDAPSAMLESPGDPAAGGAPPQLLAIRRLASPAGWAVVLAAPPPPPDPVAEAPATPADATPGRATLLPAVALGAAGIGALFGMLLPRRSRRLALPPPAAATPPQPAPPSASEREARQALSELRAICDTIPVGLALLDPTGMLLSANLRMAAFAGLPAESLPGRRIADVLPPPLAEAIQAGQAQVLREGRPVLDAPLTVEAPGVLRHNRNLLVSCHPVRGPSGRIEAVSASVQDVTERARAEAGRDLLVHELNHRVKNTLVTVQTIAQQTLRHAGDDPASFERSFAERLRTLARAHDLLTAHAWGATELRLVVQAALAPWLGDIRLTTETGPEVMLRPAQAQALVLSLHELATNAAKHGALTRDEGHVRLGWTQDRDGVVQLSWTESGGPPVPPQPARRGFGTRLLERALRHDLGSGAVPEIVYDPLGLRVTIRFRPGGMLLPAAAAPAIAAPAPVARTYASVAGWNSSSGATARAASPSASA